MSTFKKHVGRIKNTDRRCVVVYMQIPDNEDKALIVDTDALPDRFHDALMDIIDSTEGQATPHLHTLLSRRILPDLGVDMLNALHHYGQLRPTLIDNIIMYPAPNAPCPLRTIVDYVNGTVSTILPESKLENRILENQRSDREEGHLNVARNILMQAADLEAEANRKREQAYRMAPSLRPLIESTPERPVEPDYHNIESRTEPDHPDANDASTGTVDVIQKEDGEKSVMVDIEDLPADVAKAYLASLEKEAGDTTLPFPETETSSTDVSDDLVQAFLDRAAFREDRSDREKWEAMQPKKPVGRPRNDGQPAGSKPEVAPSAPKKRGRPPKVKANV